MYRQISTNGLRILGKGKSGTVYQAANGKAVKIYRKDFGEAEVLKEFQAAVLMEDYRIPANKVYEIVKSGDSFGIVFEFVQGVSLLNCVFNEPSKLDYYAAIYSRALRELHNVVVEQDYGLSVRHVFEEKIESISAFDRDEYDVIKMTLHMIPDRLNLVHMDATPANLLIRSDGSYSWVDLESCGTGHPVYDLQKLFCPDFIENLPGFHPGVARILRNLWECVNRNYFSEIDKNRMPAIHRGIRFLSFLSLLYIMQREMRESPFLSEQTAYLKDAVWQDLMGGLDYNW